PSDFDFAMLDERNAFLSGKMNAVFERPISAALSKFGGRVPQGQLIDDVEKDTLRMVQRYVGAMQKASYPNMLFELENYARKINGLCAKYKPHDDRYPEQQRADALYTAFYYLKNLMIMLRPFVPGATDRLREALRLPPEVFSVEQLGTPLVAGHEVGPNGSYFPNVLGVSAEDDGDG
ncbi:MAG: methionine--tRNA ligase, partial [Myxococcota bacterium]